MSEYFGNKYSNIHTQNISNIDQVYNLLRGIESIFEQGPVLAKTQGLGWFGYLGYDTIFMIEDKIIPRTVMMKYL